jgi:hypothetical protein
MGTRLLAGTLAALLSGGCSRACGGAGAGRTDQTPVAPAAPQADAQTDARAPRCDVFCSRTKPRTAVAVITWALNEAVPQAGLAGRMAEQSVEVTVHKEGFAKGAFARLAGVGENKPFAGLTPADRPIPGLGALVVTQVQTLQERLREEGSGGENAGIAARGQEQDPSRVVVVEIEGLEAGLNYYWRVPGAPGGGAAVTARCQAPVCPADVPDAPGPGGGGQ